MPFLQFEGGGLARAVCVWLVFSFILKLLFLVVGSNCLPGSSWKLVVWLYGW